MAPLGLAFTKVAAAFDILNFVEVGKDGGDTEVRLLEARLAQSPYRSKAGGSGLRSDATLTIVD